MSTKRQNHNPKVLKSGLAMNQLQYQIFITGWKFFYTQTCFDFRVSVYKKFGKAVEVQLW